MHVVIDCKTKLSGEQLRKLLAEESIRLSSLDHYRIDRTTSSSKLLLGFGGIPEEELEEALTTLFEELKKICIQKTTGSS